MTVGEIFGRISAHQVEGMMFHEQMSDYYDFLGLDGYRCCHKYHYICETINRAKIHKFFINHYNKLVADSPVNSGSIMPVGWDKVTRLDIDPATKKNAVKNGVSEWHKWETKTKELYLQMRKELMDMGELTAAEMVDWLIEETEEEIRSAEHKTIYLTAIGYDLSDIYDCQEKIKEKYHEKLHCLKKCMMEGC